MKHRDFQLFLDTVTSRRPRHLPFQKLRILNTVAIHQREGNLPSEARLIDSLLMPVEFFNHLVVDLISEGLLETFPCSWDGNRRLLILTETGALRVDSLIDQFQPVPTARDQDFGSMCA